MKKTILFLLLNVVSLYAAQATQNEMQSIYMEALLFIGVCGTMGIISYIYSNKHAKTYKNSKEEKKRKEDNVKEDAHKIERVEALSKMFKEGAILPEEFAILKKHYVR